MPRIARFLLVFAALWLPIPSDAQYPNTGTPSYAGLWWKSPGGSESGWGLNIAHQGDVLFATWFTYDAAGNGMWLVMPSAMLVPNNDYDPYYGNTMPTTIDYMGPIYRTTGPAYDSAAFDSSQVKVTQVGNAYIRFNSPNTGTFEYTADGVTQAKLITKQAFSTMPACDFNAGGGNFQDLWWRSPAGSEQGWGVNIAHQGDMIFATWFTYDSAGKGMWLVMSEGRKTATNTYTGSLYRTTGPAFSAQPWDGSKVRVTEVGTGTFTFTGASSGTFNYTVNGVPGSKAITRQVFSSPVSVCR